MSSLEPRTPRSVKERRAYQLVVVGGISAAVFVVGVILAIAGVIGGGIPIAAGVLAAVCALLFRSTVARR